MAVCRVSCNSQDLNYVPPENSTPLFALAPKQLEPEISIRIETGKTLVHYRLKTQRNIASTEQTTAIERLQSYR
jgi:hypothetical protein